MKTMDLLVGAVAVGALAGGGYLAWRAFGATRRSLENAARPKPKPEPRPTDA